MEAPAGVWIAKDVYVCRPTASYYVIDVAQGKGVATVCGYSGSMGLLADIKVDTRRCRAASLDHFGLGQPSK